MSLPTPPGGSNTRELLVAAPGLRLERSGCGAFCAQTIVSSLHSRRCGEARPGAGQTYLTAAHIVTFRYGGVRASGAHSTRGRAGARRSDPIGSRPAVLGPQARASTVFKTASAMIL